MRRTVLVLAGLLAALAYGGGAQSGSPTTCADRLLQDWRDGRINHVYSVPCYRAALSELPEDLRIYSSAESDLTRALLARIKATGTKKDTAAKPSSSGGHGVSLLMVVAICGSVLVAAGSVLALRR